MTNFEKIKLLELNIEAWHLFYESFMETTNAILAIRGTLVEMQHEVIKAGKANPDNPKIKATQERIDSISDNLDPLEKLNNRCIMLQEELRKKKHDIFELQKQISKLELKELNKGIE